MNEIPEVYLFKSQKHTESEAERIANVCRNWKIELPVARPELAERRREQAANATSDILLWLHDTLNLDAVKRVPPMEQLHYFSRDEWIEVAKSNGCSENTLGFNTPANAIFMLESGNEHEMYGVLSHELIHKLGRTTVDAPRRLSSDGETEYDITPVLYGYRNLKNQSFNWLNEAVTEMINIEVLSMSRSMEAKDALSNMTTYYKNGVIAIDMIIEDMAHGTGRNVAEIRNELFKGYFDGDTVAFKTINGYFGTGAIKRLSEMRDTNYPSDLLCTLLTFPFKLDKESFMNRVAALETSEPVTLSSGATFRTNAAAPNRS